MLTLDKKGKSAHNAIKAGATILDIKTLISTLDKDKSLRHFPDRGAKWFLENTDNLYGLLRSVEERAVLEQIVSETQPHLGLSEEEEQLMQSMAEHYLQQGIEQGIEQGETHTKREDILKLLRLRFHTVPETLAENIRGLDNRSRLETLFEKAATSQTLEEFYTEVDAPAEN